jgi:hypothetical protein
LIGKLSRPDLVLPNTWNPSLAKKARKTFYAPKCEALTADILLSIFDWIAVEPKLARVKGKKRDVTEVVVADSNLGEEIEAEEEDEDEEDEEVVSGVEPLDEWESAKTVPTCLPQTMISYKAALKEYYRLQKVGHLFTNEIDSQLDGKIACYKKIVGWKKAQGIMDIKEGKRALSFEAYSKVAQTLLGAKPESVSVEL